MLDKLRTSSHRSRAVGRQVSAGKNLPRGKTCRVVASLFAPCARLPSGKTCLPDLGTVCRSIAARKCAREEKTALYQAFVDCARHGTRLADKTARPFGRAHDRATNSNDRNEREVASAAAAATSSSSTNRRLSVALIDDGFSLTDLAQNTGAGATTAPQPANANKPKNNDPTANATPTPYVAAPNQPAPTTPALPSDGKALDASRRSEQCRDSGDRPNCRCCRRRYDCRRRRWELPRPPIRAAPTATAPHSGPTRSTRALSPARRSMPRSRTPRWRRCRRISSMPRTPSSSRRDGRQAGRRRDCRQSVDRGERDHAAFDGERDRARNDLAANHQAVTAPAATPKRTTMTHRGANRRRRHHPDDQRSVDPERFPAEPADPVANRADPGRCRGSYRRALCSGRRAGRGQSQAGAQRRQQPHPDPAQAGEPRRHRREARRRP